MMTTTKTHTPITAGTIRIIRERCFAGEVARRADYDIGERWSADYTGWNPAAHGGITVTEEDSGAGRRRDVNINGCHIEVGPWGPTRTQRQAHADRLRRDIPAPPSPIQLTLGELSVVASVDGDGMLLLTPDFQRGLSRAEEDDICASLPSDWLEAAKAVRAATLAWQRAAEDV